MRNNVILKRIMFLFASFIGCVVLGSILFYVNKDSSIMIRYIFSNAIYKFNKTSIKINPKEVKEVHLTSLGEILYDRNLEAQLKDEDFIFIPNLTKKQSSILNDNITKIPLNLMIGQEAIFVGSNLEKQNISTNSNIFSSNFNGNKIAYIYYNGNFSVKEVSSLLNSIKSLKNNNYFLVASLGKYNSKQFLYLLANSGVNLIFTDTSTNLKFEKYKNSIVVYNLNQYSKDYIPSYNFVFGDNTPIAFGLKVNVINVHEEKSKILEDINKNSLGFLFQIREQFNFLNY